MPILSTRLDDTFSQVRMYEPDNELNFAQMTARELSESENKSKSSSRFGKAESHDVMKNYTQENSPGEQLP